MAWIVCLICGLAGACLAIFLGDWLTGLCLAGGVAAWLFSDLQFQRDMGKLLVFMFTANMFGAILILPAIASFLLKPRKLAPGEKPVMVSRH